VKLRTIVLTSLIAADLACAAAAQFQPGQDPYSQPVQPNQGFRFSPDAPPPAPMQPAPPPQYPPQFAPPPQQPVVPPFVPPQPAGPQFQPPPNQFVQPQPGPAVAPTAPPPGPYQPAAGPSVPFIPGFDPNEAPAANPGPPGVLFQPSQIVATVGNLYILYGDVSPTVEQMIGPALAKASPEEREQIEMVRPRLVQQVTRQLVEQKILYLEFERELESKAGREKMAEIRQDISRKMRESFERELYKMREKVMTATPEELQDLAKRDSLLARLAILMKEHQIETLADLDTVLRRYGSSLEKMQRNYLEINLGRMSIAEKLKTKQEVSHLEMLQYYREHADDFAVKARARFEILTVKFANFPNKELAWRQIAAMGNDVFLGTPFATVAKRGSQEPHADKGGYYDWTTENSLASDVINNAVFTLEPGKLSPILEDDKGFHIVRVIERQPAGYIPFTDAQVKIKELINRQRQDAAVKAHLEQLRAKTVVWTIFDAESPANMAQQPSNSSQR
jgi:parvulin-like peptidyl-prolyl isomerase